MSLFRDLRRLGARVLAPVALSAALLTACGGGTSQVQAFRPARLVVMGDESSALAAATDANGKPDGLKYSVNDRSTTTTTGQCLLLPTFAQTVATLYGFVFAECNVGNATVKAYTVAEAGATSASLAGQLLDAKVSGTPLNAQDLVTVMVGANDMVDLYRSVRSGSRTRAEAVLEAQRLGSQVAAFVNDRVLATGARAIVLTIPDMGLSPYAIRENQTHAGARQLLSDLSYEFNAYLRTRIDSSRFDGRNYALVLADDVAAAMARAPGAFLASPANAVDAACDVPTGSDDDAAVRSALLACTTTNLVTPTGQATATSATSHLWASDRHLGPAAHARIGSQAQSRLLNNPF